MAEPLACDPFEALADHNRREIVQMLGDGERSVQEIADRLPISRPAVSRHLRLLKESRLVTDRPDGTRRIYRLDDRGAAEIGRYLEELWGGVARRYSIATENTRDRSR